MVTITPGGYVIHTQYINHPVATVMASLLSKPHAPTESVSATDAAASATGSSAMSDPSLGTTSPVGQWGGGSEVWGDIPLKIEKNKYFRKKSYCGGSYLANKYLKQS